MRDEPGDEQDPEGLGDFEDDSFADDNFDEEAAPLEDEDRDALQQDLVDVQVLKRLLGPKGIKGAVFFCPDCDDDHFLGWDLLAGNLRELLDQGSPPVHEPAFDPDPDDYVSWDYARGFLDGYESFQFEGMEEVETKLLDELTKLEWPPDRVKGFMARIGIEARPPRGDAAEDQS